MKIRQILQTWSSFKYIKLGISWNCSEVSHLMKPILYVNNHTLTRLYLTLKCPLTRLSKLVQSHRWLKESHWKTNPKSKSRNGPAFPFRSLVSGTALCLMEIPLGSWSWGFCFFPINWLQQLEMWADAERQSSAAEHESGRAFIVQHTHFSSFRCQMFKAWKTSAGHSPGQAWQRSIHELTPQQWHHTPARRPCAVHSQSTRKLKRQLLLGWASPPSPKLHCLLARVYRSRPGLWRGPRSCTVQHVGDRGGICVPYEWWHCRKSKGCGLQKADTHPPTSTSNLEGAKEMFSSVFYFSASSF